MSIHTLTKDGSNVDGSIHPGMGGEGGSSLMRSASLRSSVAAYPVPRARERERERGEAKRERERCSCTFLGERLCAFVHLCVFVYGTT